MILDTLDHAYLYESLSPRLARALAFLRSNDLAALGVGKHAVDGEDLFAVVSEYTTNPPTGCVWEAHRRYVDVQTVVGAPERMGWRPLEGAAVTQPYDAEKDFLLVEAGGDYITVSPGMFAVFFPTDAHCPTVMAGAPAAVRKIVIKCAVAGFDSPQARPARFAARP